MTPLVTFISGIFFLAIGVFSFRKLLKNQSDEEVQREYTRYRFKLDNSQEGILLRKAGISGILIAGGILLIFMSISEN